MEKKRPQLSLDELHRLKWLLGGVLSLFSVWTVFYLDVDAWTLLGLNTAAIGAVLIWPKLPEYVPRWVHIAAFPVIVGIFLVDAWLSAQGQILAPMIRLDLMLILYRSISHRGRRDDLQLIVLGLFLVVVAGVITVSLAFAFQIVAFTGCALLLLFVITLVDAAEAQDPPVRTPLFTWRIATVTPAWTRHGDWPRLWARVRAVTDWRVAVLGAVLFAGVVVISGLLFLAIPRFQLENSLFLDRFISKKSRTGFTDNIKFGDVTDIMNDTSLALSVDIPDTRNVPVPLYLRMVVLDEYRSGGFKLSADLRRDFKFQEKTQEVNGTEPIRRGDPSTFWTFYFEAGVSRYLPLPGSFRQLRFTELQNVQASSRLRAVALSNEPVTMTAFRLYGVNVSPFLDDPPFAESLRVAAAESRGKVRPPARNLLLALPLPPADVAALRAADADLSGAKPLTPLEFAQRACAWLQARHAYSLQSSLPAGSGDPLVRWIGSREPGHCELFAGAFVVLARAAGHPARLVSGFKSGTWNGFSRTLTVSNSEAHAWCEIWDGTGAWLRVDPTPGAAAVGSTDEPRGESAIASHSDHSWKARLVSLRIFWYRRIVNFDQRSQLDTLRAVKAATQETGTRLRAEFDRRVEAVKRWLQSPWDVRRAVTMLAAVLAVAGAAWGLRVAARGWRWRFRRRRDGGMDPVRAEAGRWLARLQPPAGGQGTAPRLRRIGAQAARDEWRPILADLERLRYGPRPTWPPPEPVFRRARKLGREMGRRGAGEITR